MAETKKNKRLIGVVIPVGALRTSSSAGCGEFLDLVEFAKLCADIGAGLLQLLPVNDTGYESSPYFALTAFALNPIYMKLSALPEAAGFQQDITALRDQFEHETRFPYEKVARAKLALLRTIFSANQAEIGQSAELKKWIGANDWIKIYSVYRRLKEANEFKSWQEWKLFRSVSKKDIDSLWHDKAAAEENLFWAWIQFSLDKQFSRAAEAVAKLGITLLGDIPILMNEDSADVWAYPEYFNNEFSAGAPPDMYSPAGQNWGFPIYNWAEQEKDGFSWWRERLATAQKYFSAYRIDHVLGFFRIWASSRKNTTALLGRFIPSVPLTAHDLRKLGCDDGRIRWISRPHIPTAELYDAVHICGGSDDDARAAFDAALERIGNEELWLFKGHITGERDIAALHLCQSAKNYLIAAWSNRLVQEYDAAQFAVVWNYHDSRAWKSLTEAEKSAFESLIAQKNAESEKKWEIEGNKLLTVLKEASSMLPCAEDLGAVPACVPAVLTKLGILGLRVVRWTRSWDEQDQRYIPFYQYPELSICTPAVHDSSTVREWWEREADQNTFAAFAGAPGLARTYNPGVARTILKASASAASRFRVFQIQDLLHLSARWYAPNCADERVNVPGTMNGFNWTYRLPASCAELSQDKEFINAARDLAVVPVAPKPSKPKKTD